jgi:excisionase family DNA binding protein
MSANGRRLLDADEAATLLGITRRQIYAMARDGSIPHLRIGRYLKFRRAALELWVGEQEIGSRSHTPP